MKLLAYLPVVVHCISVRHCEQHIGRTLLTARTVVNVRGNNAAVLGLAHPRRISLAAILRLPPT